MSDIRRILETLNRKKAALTATLALLQIACKHPAPHMRYRGSSGNYDSSSDSYWIDWHCPDCDKRWLTDQGHEHTSKYPNAIKVRGR